jgi:hypothetical protein
MPTHRDVGRGFFVHSRQNKINTLVQPLDVVQTINRDYLVLGKPRHKTWHRTKLGIKNRMPM